MPYLEVGADRRGTSISSIKSHPKTRFKKLRIDDKIADRGRIHDVSPFPFRVQSLYSGASRAGRSAHNFTDPNRYPAEIILQCQTPLPGSLLVCRAQSINIPPSTRYVHSSRAGHISPARTHGSVLPPAREVP